MARLRLWGRDGILQHMMRVGSGYDVHRLVPGRDLVLGGIVIDHHMGLAGHSDADVLVHAVCDALLGAAGCGDIGSHFPDTDKEYKDIYSIRLLERTCKLIGERGFDIVNIDSTLFAQKPRLSPYIDSMRERLSEAAGIRPELINVKATTTEGLGFAGREEGIAAQSTVLLVQNRTA